MKKYFLISLFSLIGSWITSLLFILNKNELLILLSIFLFGVMTVSILVMDNCPYVFKKVKKLHEIESQLKKDIDITNDFIDLIKKEALKKLKIDLNSIYSQAKKKNG